MTSNDKKTAIKCVALMSGGLDSTLAAKLMLDQGIEISAVIFSSPFYGGKGNKGAGAAAVIAAKQLGDIPIVRIQMGDDYLEMVRKPRHGYGTGMNPCIDCRIMQLQKAGNYMQEIGARFLVTGEVLGQRPMSQQKRAITIIDKESRFKGFILRPLSAGLLDQTIPEQEGWVNRERLLEIEGRSRKVQISLAAQKGITDYPSPAGGCLLTDKVFSDRMRDYFAFTDQPTMADIPLLKVGRHFRLESGDKVIVARNEAECGILKRLCPEDSHLLFPLGFTGPVAVLQGKSVEAAVQKIIVYTKRAIPETASVVHWHKGESETIALKRYH